MAQFQISVIRETSGRKRLPDWATVYVRVVEELRARGLLEAAGQHLQVARQGGYCGMDILLFLLAFFCWGGGTSFKEFGLACQGFGPALAAVGGRRRWPAPSSVSRFLAVVLPADAQTFTKWALSVGSCGDFLLSSPLAQARDTFGRGWTVLDFDPVCLVARQRALPEGDDLPIAQREAEDLCKAGYPGRKRGETQVSQSRLQHAGTGQWLGASTVPGNANMANGLSEDLNQAMPTLMASGIRPGETVVRFDGAGGHAACMDAVTRTGEHYLTRLGHYETLQYPDVCARLAQASWSVAPDSGSGPTRDATELSAWQEHSPANSADVSPEIDRRLVVSRFPARDGEKHGAGTVIEGWQYEIYQTDLAPDAWPAAELVELYYGRNGQENRFAQLNRELDIDRVFSWQPNGQQVVTTVALWVWNLHTMLGAELCAPLGTSGPQPARSIVEAPPQAPLPMPEPPIIPATKVIPPTKVILPPAVPQSTPQLVDVTATSIEDLDWLKLLERRENWQWSGANCLTCPAGVAVPLRKVRLMRDRQVAIFRAHPHDCVPCRLRTACLGVTYPGSCKEIGVTLPPGTVFSDAHAKAVASSRSAHPSAYNMPAKPTGDWRVPTPVAAGRLQALPSLLLPSVFRHASQVATRNWEVRVIPPIVEPPEKRPRHLAGSPAERQHRRKTWAERLAANSLPTKAVVRHFR